MLLLSVSVSILSMLFCILGAIMLLTTPFFISICAICGLLFIFSPPRYKEEQEKGDIVYESFTGFKKGIAE